MYLGAARGRGPNCQPSKTCRSESYSEAVARSFGVTTCRDPKSINRLPASVGGNDFGYVPMPTNTPSESSSDYLRLHDVAGMLGVSIWSVKRWARKEDFGFPAPIWLSPVTMVWRKAEIEHWISERPREGKCPWWSKSLTAEPGRAAPSTKARKRRKA